ncbi:hypothetical protein ADIWIN_0095 [Winogradskyella psychrotolerans RS-3]|uniref:Uncharacterized protein n=1 Tax=Winogradskyella psychrotolerans RS-3 TaxID=641526 RepID=S7VXA6_9FLAO|nr:hypothetical protein [Winogradskyella psychrotolerans]EPR74731.1 hypothetical protein ADIWIN_0095 [Winogradskyella psychrotolerans RS-3]
MPSNAMNVINYNRSQLPQRDRFKNVLGGYNKRRKVEYDLPKATPQQLKMIRHKLKKENQILWLKVIGVSLLILGGLLWVVMS